LADSARGPQADASARDGSAHANGLAAVAAWHGPSPSRRVQCCVQAAYLGTSAGHCRAFVIVIDRRIRLQQRDAVLQLIDAAVNIMPVAVMMPIEVAAVAGRRRKSVDRDKKRTQWEDDAEIHVLHRFDCAMLTVAPRATQGHAPS
jgi:hypothetical protein